MKNEAEAVTILKNSIIQAGGWAYKVPDPSSDFSSTIPRPFDLFGAFRLHPLYAEVKFSRGLFSFDLQTIADHQISALTELHRQVPKSWCWIVYAVSVKRGDNRLYCWDDIFEIEARRVLRKNFTKAELETLPYWSIKKNIVQMDNL